MHHMAFVNSGTGGIRPRNGVTITKGAINLLYTTRGKKGIRGRESGFCN